MLDKGILIFLNNQRADFNTKATYLDIPRLCNFRIFYSSIFALDGFF